MAHFVRTRPSGFWTINSDVLPAEFESLDEKSLKAINGDEGGVWAPTAAIEIGGIGLKISGLMRSTGQFLFEGSAGGIFSGGNVLFSNDVQFIGAYTVSFATTLTLILGQGIQVLGGDLNVYGAGARQAVHSEGKIDVYSNGDIDIGSDGALNIKSGGTVETAAGSSVTIEGTLTLNGTSQTLNKTLTCSGQGTVAWRRVVAPDANATYHVQDYDEVRIPNGLSAARTYTLGNNGATAGKRIRFTRPLSTSATFVANVSANAGGLNTALGGTGSTCEWVDFIFDGSDWAYSAAGKF